MATQHNSPTMHWRILVSSGDDGYFWPAHDSGDVGRDFRFFAKSFRVNVKVTFLSFANSAPTRTKDVS